MTNTLLKVPIQNLLNYWKEDRMDSLIVSAQSSLKEKKVLKIKNASILKRGKRKYWIARFDVFIDNNIISKSKEESTKVLLEEENREYMQNTYLPAWIQTKEDELRNAKNHSTKFEYYAAMHLEDYKRNKDYPSMEGKVNRILTDFGEYEISSITKLQIRRWINNLCHAITGEELTKATRKKYKTVFNFIFELALDEDTIPRNFIHEIKVKGKDSSKDAVKVFSKQEVQILLEASKDTKYGELLHPYLGLVFNQGISPSEALGLQVGDIRTSSMGKTTLYVQRGVTKKVEDVTKNEYRQREMVLRDAAKVYIDILMTMAYKRHSLWLFSNEDGSRLDDIENIRGIKEYFNKKKGYYEHRNTKWYKLLEDCNLEFRHIKNCRHTFTMAMLDSKQYSHTELADMLGHSDLQMIIKHYAKSIKGKAEDMDGTFDIYASDILGDSDSLNKEVCSLKVV